MENCNCLDCGKKIDSSSKFCDRCLSIWYAENNIPDDAPSGDFQEYDGREIWRGDE